MKFAFKDKNDGVCFEYSEAPPQTENKVNLTALQMYGLYRNSVYDSYKEKTNLAADIKSFERVYSETVDSKLSQNTLYLDPLYHYAVSACLDATNEWLI